MRYEIYRDKSAAGLWRWRFRAANNEIIGTSGTGYNDIKECRNRIELMKKSLEADVIEVPLTE